MGHFNYSNKNIDLQKPIAMKKLRIQLLNDFFIEVDPWIKREIDFQLCSICFQFQSLNILKNSVHEVENWNINSASFNFFIKFPKDTKLNVKLKTIYCLNPNEIQSDLLPFLYLHFINL